MKTFNQMQTENINKVYKEHSGSLIKKYRNILGKYVFVIDENGKKAKVCVGNSIYKNTELGSKLTVGEINRKLVNIRLGICKNNNE